MCVYGSIVKKEYLLDLITNNEQFKKKLFVLVNSFYGKFGVISLLPQVTRGSFNKGKWNLRSSRKWWELVLNTQVTALLEKDVPSGFFKLSAFQLTKVPLLSGSLYI